MTDEIMMHMNEDGSWGLYEPYATIECETKEDYDSLVEMLELARSIVRCKECKWYETDGEPCGLCKFWPDEGYRDPDHFCAEGVKRDDHV